VVASLTHVRVVVGHTLPTHWHPVAKINNS